MIACFVVLELMTFVSERQQCRVMYSNLFNATSSFLDENRPHAFNKISSGQKKKVFETLASGICRLSG